MCVERFSSNFAAICSEILWPFKIWHMHLFLTHNADTWEILTKFNAASICFVTLALWFLLDISLHDWKQLDETKIVLPLLKCNQLVQDISTGMTSNIVSIHNVLKCKMILVLNQVFLDTNFSKIKKVLSWVSFSKIKKWDMAAFTSLDFYKEI